MMDPFDLIKNHEASDFLLDGMDVSIANEVGDSLLHKAVAWKNKPAARRLIQNRINVNHQNKRGMTPLHYCAEYGEADIAGLILAAGGDPHIVDKHQNAPLWTATMKSKGSLTEIIRVLLDHGADPLAKNKYGKSPMDIAVSMDCELAEVFKMRTSY